MYDRVYAPAQSAPVLYEPLPATAGAELALVGQQPAAALTLYQVPVPGAVQVTMPNGTRAWARPVVERLESVAYPAARRRAEPLPVWVRATCYIPLALSAAAFVAAEALRVAVPALHELVGILTELWHFALVAAVIFGVLSMAARAGLRRLGATGGEAATAAPAASPVIISGEGGEGRWFGKGGTGVHIGKLTINR